MWLTSIHSTETNPEKSQLNKRYVAGSVAHPVRPIWRQKVLVPTQLRFQLAILSILTGKKFQEHENTGLQATTSPEYQLEDQPPASANTVKSQIQPCQGRWGLTELSATHRLINQSEGFSAPRVCSWTNEAA